VRNQLSLPSFTAAATTLLLLYCDQQIVPKQELLAMGAANSIGSIFGSFTSSASLSRTSVVHSIGGQTVMHNAPAILIMILALTCITELLYYLPKAVLSAVIFAAVSGMIEFHEAKRLYRTSKVCFVLLLLLLLLLHSFDLRKSCAARCSPSAYAC
jgi:sulfate permease, SulP family